MVKIEVRMLSCLHSGIREDVLFSYPHYLYGGYAFPFHA